MIQDPGFPISANANSVVASALAPSLPAVLNQLNWLTKVIITGAGATAASVIAVTITGLSGGTQTFFLTVPAGVAVPLTPLIISFEDPLPAAAPNTAIVVNVPSFGAGNVAAACVMNGRQT